MGSGVLFYQTDYFKKGMTMALINKESGLSYVMGDEELYKEVLSVYVEDAQQLQESIEDALAKEDYPLLRTHVHALKSTSLTIGAQSLFQKGEGSGRCLQTDQWR